MSLIPRTYNIDSSRIADAITARKRAVLPIHLYGQPTDMDSVMATARQYGLKVIEDAGKPRGPNIKGDERAVWLMQRAGASIRVKTTDDDDLANQVRVLRSYGSQVKHQYEIRGFNS